MIPAQPAEPPREMPPGDPRPEIPTPVREPDAPPQPNELPGKTPDELPVRGPAGLGASYPATDSSDPADLPGSQPDVVAPVAEPPSM